MHATPETVPWIVKVSESRINYWATYGVDLSLMTFFLAYDGMRLEVPTQSMLGLCTVGLCVWTLVEYIFHRWVYHVGLAITTEGHEKHHQDPTATIAMPAVVTPILFLPIWWAFSVWWHVAGFASVLGGFFCGFIGYSFTHYSLHRYKMQFPMLRHLQSQHRIHHGLPEYNFGVTTRFWDRVFGTEFVKETRLVKVK
jgi:sterol desaturase/sphingolipid hydroxylase (fatty acid hydroxylase superfamily)